MSNLMTTKEAAEYLKLNYMTVYKLSQRGRIPASKIGGNWRFRKDLLDDWLAKQATVLEGTVLVVDDDPAIVEMVNEVVSRKGFKVVGAGSGEQALEELEKQHFDLIFMDLVLPGMSGVEALSAIKEKDKKAVVVIITGYGDDPIAMDAMSLGPLFLIRKPFRVSDIVEVLNAVVRVR
ncbi:MAG: response regulator [Dehalococcoidia bacterium]|nr:MAG: response regulator [Dehalococcoidia bacterium]